MDSPGPSDRSRTVALLLAALLGPFGAHRFYVGKVRTGILMAATIGGVGLWYVYDLILVATGSFRDIDGRLLTRWEPEEPGERPGVSEEVLLELDALRSEVAELAERMDFTERLLARTRAQQELRPGSAPITPSP